jgi:hypothetical protein
MDAEQAAVGAVRVEVGLCEPAPEEHRRVHGEDRVALPQDEAVAIGRVQRGQRQDAV